MVLTSPLQVQVKFLSKTVLRASAFLVVQEWLRPQCDWHRRHSDLVWGALKQWDEIWYWVAKLAKGIFIWYTDTVLSHTEITSIEGCFSPRDLFNFMETQSSLCVCPKRTTAQPRPHSYILKDSPTLSVLMLLKKKKEAKVSQGL